MADDLTKKIEAKGTSQKGQGSAYDNPKQDPKYKEKWAAPNLKVYKDAVYDRISELLLKQWSEIEEFVDGDGLEALQKTYKDGKLVVGRDVTDLLVVYESDVEANADDAKVEGAIIDWLEFIDVNQMTLKIVRTAELTEEGKPSPPNLILQAPDKTDFNLNEIIGTLELADINLKDNVSQFMAIDKVKTEINRSKFNEYVDTKFGELTPETFTHYLEMYIRLKNTIPLRYRSDDFFAEYFPSDLSVGYKIEKLFEGFEYIKYEIDKGILSDYNSLGNVTGQVSDKELFGWETLTYLVTESQKIIGTKNPIFNQSDAKSWWDRISNLEEQKELLTINNDKLAKEVQRLLDIIANMTGSLDAPVPGCADPTATNYNPSATTDDGSCVYTGPPAEEMVTITAVGTGMNNPGPRVFSIQSSDGNVIQNVYSENSGRGLRMTVISADSLSGGRWDGVKLYDEVYDLRAGNTNKQKMAEDILGGDWEMNDLFVITSYDSVAYNDLLIEALKSIGGCYPRLVSGLLDENEVDAATPYVLVGSKGLGECAGYEDVQDDGQFTPPAKIVKEWRPLLGREGGWDTGPPDEVPVPGCTDPTATNFNVNATTEDGSCQYAGPADMVKGCTDSTAMNFNSLAQIDDGSCVYKPPPAYEETFDKWQDTYSPNNYWWRAAIGNVLKTDGPTGAGDAGVRIYRTEAKGKWPGALYNPVQSTISSPSFDKHNVDVDHLWLQEGRSYKFSFSARCNTDNTVALANIADKRVPYGSGYSYTWTNSLQLTTNNQWTDGSFTFTPKKNKYIGGSTKWKLKYWHYPGGASPSWSQRQGGDQSPAAEEERPTIDIDWGTNATITGQGDNFMIEVKGWSPPPPTPGGTYKFRIYADDGCMLWVNGERVINSWVDTGAVNRDSVGIVLNEPAKIQLRYYEHGSIARLAFSWSGPGIGNGTEWKLVPAYHSDERVPLFEGIMGNIYLYAGNTNGAQPGQYCDYANIKVEELVRSGGSLKSYELGGAIKSSPNTGPTREVNPDIRLPQINLNLVDEISKQHSVRLNEGIDTSKNCAGERRLLQSFGNLSLIEMRKRLTEYTSKNVPCLNVPVSFQNGGSTCCATSCGDTTGDGIVNVLDVVAFVDILLSSGGQDSGAGLGDIYPCLDIAGGTSDGQLNVHDLIPLLDAVMNQTIPTGCNVCDDNDGSSCAGVMDCAGNLHSDICEIDQLSNSERWDACGNCGIIDNTTYEGNCDNCCLSFTGDMNVCPPPEEGGTEQKNICYHVGNYTHEGGIKVNVKGDPLDYYHCAWSFGDGCKARTFGSGGRVKGRTTPIPTKFKRRR